MDFINLMEVESKAVSVLPKMFYDYYASGSETQSTLAENRKAFERYRILPRVLVDVSNVSTSCQLFGHHLSIPVLVAPMAMHGLAHPDRELATARAAVRCGVPMVVSTMATSSLEEVAEALQGQGLLIFQLYVFRNRQVVASWILEAERRGYKAIMVTVDAPKIGRREADERNRFRLPDHLQLKNLHRLHQGQLPAVTEGRDTSEGSALFKLSANEFDTTLTWELLSWIKSISSLPVLVKGILDPRDAALAIKHGADGLVVSNHGGRQLDCAPSPLEVLPRVVHVVAGRIPVLVDGGVRRGTDIIKALALGANAVMVGRPVLYGLAVGGQEGVEKVLDILKAEFHLALTLAGRPSPAHLGRDMLLPPPEVPDCGGSCGGDATEPSPTCDKGGRGGTALTSKL